MCSITTIIVENQQHQGGMEMFTITSRTVLWDGNLHRQPSHEAWNAISIILQAVWHIFYVSLVNIRVLSEPIFVISLCMINWLYCLWYFMCYITPFRWPWPDSLDDWFNFLLSLWRPYDVPVICIDVSLMSPRCWG